jgi:DNA-directed RNA polymerase specialized sigma subunit
MWTICALASYLEATMGESELAHLREMLETHMQRLYMLELKEALQGINTPAEILIELENVRKKIIQCRSKIGDLSQANATISEGSQPKAADRSNTGRKQVEITFNGRFDDLTPEIQRAVVRAIAGIVEIPPDQITVLTVMPGSVIVLIELPTEEANTLLNLYESGDKIIGELEIKEIRVVSEKVSSLSRLVENTRLYENALQQLTVADLAQKCAQETDLYFAHQNFDSKYCFELFRLAIQNKDEQALEAVMIQYTPLVARWVDRWLNKHPDYSPLDEDPQDFVSQAFERFWISFTPAKFDKSRNITDILKYLRMCVDGAIMDASRKLRRVQLEQEMGDNEQEFSEPAPTPEELLQADEFWQLIKKKLKDEREYTVIYASFKLELSPREILAEYPGLFSDIKEIYQHKANLLERLKLSGKDEDREIRAYIINKKDASDQ